MGLPITIELPPGFLDAEERSGFVVSEKRKKIWAVELDLLDKYLAVCKKYDIHTQVFSGTLLGAVRHKGFIPWDDDIDVCLDRANFDKLQKVPKDEFKFPYFLQTAESDVGRFCPYARLRNSLTTGAITWHRNSNYNNGIYMDIFVLDNYVGSDALRQKQFSKLAYYGQFLDDYYHPAKFNWTFRSFIYKYVLTRCYHLLGRDYLLKKFRQCITQYGENELGMSLLTHGDWYARRYRMTRPEYSETTYLDFEWVKVPASKLYHDVLSRNYGNYMKLPSKDQMGKWHDGIISFDPDTSYTEKKQ